MQLFGACWVKPGYQKSQVNMTFALTATWQVMIPMCIRWGRLWSCGLGLDMPADFFPTAAASWTVSILFVPKRQCFFTV